MQTIDHRMNWQEFLQGAILTPNRILLDEYHSLECTIIYFKVEVMASMKKKSGQNFIENSNLIDILSNLLSETWEDSKERLLSK